MTQLLLILTVLLTSSAFAEMSQSSNDHLGSGMTYGSSNGIQRYYDSRGNTGTSFNKYEPGISQSYFNRRSGMMQNSGTMLDMPMGNTPMGMPLAAPEIMIPSQPFGSGSRQHRSDDSGAYVTWHGRQPAIHLSLILRRTSTQTGADRGWDFLALVGCKKH